MKLTKEVVEKISSIKGEPKWMLDFRLRSLDAFLKSNNPNFGPKLDIDYDNITYYKERENNLTDNWTDDLGIIFLVMLEIFLMIWVLSLLKQNT